ncbi:MAG TPA: hypothetical protein VHY22_19245, partial [Chthoniobacteraceae bacterium]|nr:hypothetical protein [Chthoniobacteraceae bacterium]
ANFTKNQVTGNIDLGHITIEGNLGQIYAGDNIVSTPAIASLNVQSMTTAAESEILGPIANMHLSGDFNAYMDVIGYQFGTVSHLYIGGSLAADSAGDSYSGTIEFTGHIGSATIGNIVGGSGNNSGELLGDANFSTYINSLHVTGSITGSGGAQSGSVTSEILINKVMVDGSLYGGAGLDSGVIAAPLRTVVIGGGINGGSGVDSGSLLSLIVTSSGSQQSDPQLTGSGISVFQPIGAVKIGGDVTGGIAGTAASGSTAATPGNTGIILATSAKSIVVSGSLVGGTAGTAAGETADTSGAILVNSINSLTIGGGITGGSGPHSGIVSGTALASGGSDVLTPMKYGSIVVNGDIAGGSGNVSGAILADGLFSGSIKSIYVSGNLTGSSGTQSGMIEGSTGLGSLVIGGNVTGGSANSTGEILSSSTIASAIIRGNLTGDASINSATVVNGSGYIQGGQITSLNIHGNVTSGSNSGGQIANSGAIRSTGAIDALTIGGQVTGNSSNPVIISAANGVVNAKHLTSDLAIHNIAIGQAAAYLDILAGYTPTVSNTSGIALGTPVDGSAQIGTVTFGATLSASNIVAGAEPDPTTGNFGTATNISIPSKVGDLHSSIASIIVTGAATGDSVPTDSFGIVAENLGSVIVNGVSLPTNLSPGAPESVDGSNLYLLEVT